MSSNKRLLSSGLSSGNKTYFSVSNDGVLTLGPDITWDEAAKFLLDALERQIGRRIVDVVNETKGKDAKEHRTDFEDCG